MDYSELQKLIINTLAGRPTGTQILPEGHQEIELNILDFANSLLNTISTGLEGEALTNTDPIEPDNANVAYIFQVPPSTTKTFANFKDSEGDSISVTTNSTQLAFGFLVWNKQYWKAITIMLSVSTPSFVTVSDDIVQMIDGEDDIFPKTKAVAVETAGGSVLEDLIKAIDPLASDTIAGYVFRGFATDSTVPGTPDQNVFYLAPAGTYNNFGTSIIVPNGSIGLFRYDTEWHRETINIIEIVDNLVDGGVGKALSAEQGKNLQNNKVNKSDIADNLTTDDATKPLSAKQGKVLQDSKVNKTDIADNLITDDATVPLSAKQGKVLDDKITLLDQDVILNSDIILLTEDALNTLISSGQLDASKIYLAYEPE